MLLLFTSFVAGVLTVLAPCILPVLPVIIGSSVFGGFNKKKTITIIGSLALSIVFFTFILKVSTIFISIDPVVWKIISGGIILIFGLITLFPKIWENQFIAKLSIKSNLLLGSGVKKNSFWGDVIIGAALGPVFSTCSPTYFIILATVLPVSFVLGFIYLLVYVLGLSLVLFAIALLGNKIISSFENLLSSKILKTVIGIIFVIVGLVIIFGFDKKIESKILNSCFFDITILENKFLNNK